jgi:DNA (cytosine-5)-methyltransferase 1
MTAPLMLDAYGCAGLAADGYRAAGFDVVVLDIDRAALRHAAKAGFYTVKGDAPTLLADPGFLRAFDFVHASPPCQGHSATRELAKAQGKGVGRAVDLIPQTLAALRRYDGPWIIENVNRSPVRHMDGAVRLCGSSFGLKVERHRWFAPSPGLCLEGSTCDHAGAFDRDRISGRPRPWGVYGTKGDAIPSGGRTVRTIEGGHYVMGVTSRRVPWKYLCEGLPPAYTRHLGGQVLAHLGAVPA